MYQLKFASGHCIDEQALSYQLSFGEAQAITIDKTADILQSLQTYWGEDALRSLSPSALSSYIKCSLQFYFRYVARLSENEVVQEELAVNVFGSILHSVMENLYAPYLDKPMSESDIMTLYKNDAEIYRLLDAAFAKEFYHGDDLPEDFEENGKLLITRDVLMKYTKGMLLFDARYSPFTPVSFEERITTLHPVIIGNKEVLVKLSGFADRIDLYNGVIRIIDYKTGGGKGKDKRMKFKSVESLFSHDPNERNSEAFQTFLYALMYIGSREVIHPVMPALYFVRDMYDPDFNACLIDDSAKQNVMDFSPYAEEFTSLLNNCLQQLFNSNIPFSQTEHTEFCTRSCAFRSICRR